jgi:hypothetical protein
MAIGVEWSERQLACLVNAVATRTIDRDGSNICKLITVFIFFDRSARQMLILVQTRTYDMSYQLSN